MTDLPLIRWDAPGPYVVAFSTRVGGVSTEPYETLNLGRLTGDDPARVDENRGLLCIGVGADPDELSWNRQVHSPLVRRAPSRGERADALVTDIPGHALLVLAADCVPVALARVEGPPAIAALHVGWRGLLAGLVQSAARTLGRGPLAAVLGPSIGPCCYQVGDEVATLFRNRFGRDVVRGGRLDLWNASERALRAAGVAKISRVDLCTACNPELFFSHRRDGGRTGRQGMIAFVA